MLRKTAHVIPGLLLLPIPFCADQPYVCVVLMSISYGFNGAVTVVTLTNYHDLSPNYSTTLNSIINGLGNAAGFLSPLVVAYFTAENVSKFVVVSFVELGCDLKNFLHDSTRIEYNR